MAVMSTSQSASGGVRNLRAIFEYRSSDLSSSPPSRGRSPNGSFASSHSRPLSKVRTSFVAVEKPGETGGPPQLGLRKKLEELNESAIMDDTESGGIGLGAILKGSPFEEPGKSKKPTGAAAKPATAQAPKTNGIAEKAASAARKIQESAAKVTNAKPTTTVKPQSAISTTQGQSKVESPTEAKKSPVVPANPSFPKPRGGGAKIQAVMESAKEAREARAATAAAAQAKSETVPKKEPSTATTPTTTKAPRASLPARLSRPAGSATAPTASSVAKNESVQPSEQKPADRKVVARGPPRVANATTASSLAKKSSRASIGVTEQPKARATAPRAPADEGFLARMMRPTASSAQKTHDKVQADSPPHSKPAAGPKAVKKPSRKSLASTTTDEAVDHEPAEVIPEEPSVVEDNTLQDITNGDGQQPQPPTESQAQPEQSEVATTK